MLQIDRRPFDMQQFCASSVLYANITDKLNQKPEIYQCRKLISLFMINDVTLKTVQIFVHVRRGDPFVEVGPGQVPKMPMG